MRDRAVALLLASLLAACTVGPRYEEPETPMPVRFDQATAEAAAEPADTGALGRVRQHGARRADRARARGEHHDRAGQCPPGGEPRLFRHLRLLLVPDRHHGRGPPALAVQQRRPVRAARRIQQRRVPRGLRRHLGDRPVRLAAQRVQFPGPAHRCRCSRTRGCAADDRRGDRAGLVRDDRRARAPRAAAPAAREPAGERPHPRRAGRSRGARARSTSPSRKPRCAASPPRCRRPRPTSCARSSASRC